MALSRTKLKENTKSIWDSIVTWSWTRNLLFWIILSAGTGSELAFLAASLWVSINANVHPFLVNTLGISEKMTQNLTYLATTAYVALPECIVGLAVLTTISHVRVVVYRPKDFWAWVWSILYGVPALFFLILSMITLGNAVANVNFTMPAVWVVTRAIAAFAYAFTSLLYVWMGKDQEKDRLAKKDQMIADLIAENRQKLGQLERETGAKIAGLTDENRRLAGIIESLNRDLASEKKQHSELVTLLDQSAKSALQAYSQDCIDWLHSGIKSVLPDEIPPFTGHSKRKITEAIKAGKFRFAPNNKDRILVSSLIKWLEENPPVLAKSERDTGPILRLVNE